MKILHFDCAMGAAGDMLSASLLELFDDRDAVLRELNALGVPRVRFEAEEAVRCGVRGTHLKVTAAGREEDDYLHDHGGHSDDQGHDHSNGHGHGGPSHAHRSLSDVEAVVEGLSLEEPVRRDVLAIYDSIARAESAVHGVNVTEIHFHEVGSLDAIADVAAFCLLVHKLSPDRITASPVHVGSGQVRCAHGLLPVPAPATALLLRGVPIYGGDIRGELCTPTGAALLKYYVNSFGPMPSLRTEKIGYGMGRREFPAANCVRAFWGETDGGTEEMTELRCDLDDMTGEDVAFACRMLREAGAPEVFTTAIGMKKDRPGVMITVICRPEQAREMAELLLRHTTTLGVREALCRRYVLERRTETADTSLGPVRKKISDGYGIRREKWEYEDLARLASDTGRTLREVRDLLDRET